MMEFYVLNQNFDTVAVIDVFNSIIWTDRFQECGDFELVVAASVEAFHNFKMDYYLWSPHSDHTMIIEDMVTNNDPEKGPTLTITGRSLESILERRIVWGPRTLSGNFQTEIETLLNENLISPSKPERKVDNFVFERSDDPLISDLSIETQYTGDNLYDIITSQCSERGIGFKVTLNDKKQFVFRFYIGADRSYAQIENPYVVFSPNFENLIDGSYTESRSSMRNVSLVGGEGEGSARRYTSVGNTAGLNRREVFTDASSISSDINDGITESFDFSQYPSQAFNNTTKSFVTDDLFNSCMINVIAYRGRTISITIPAYTDSDGQTSKYATVLVTSSKQYVSTLKAWERYDDDSETVDRGKLSTYELYIPEDAEYLYTSMYTQKAIDTEIYSGELTDFECSVIKISNDEYIRLLRQRGREDLLANKEISSFEGQAEATVMYTYGKDFFVGDLVQIADEYGHEAVSRVEELILSISEEGEDLYPTFVSILEEDDSTLLPEKYTLLEYIQSDGSQYINTLYVPNDKTRVVMDVEASGTDARAYFGTQDAQSVNAFTFWRISGSSVRYDYGNKVKSLAFEPNKRIVIDANQTECKVDDQLISAEKETFECSNSLALLTVVTGGVAQSAGLSAKLYSCRVYDDGTLIRNYVPCTNPDGLAGLYDLVNEKFYANSGTGNFTIGAKEV